MKDEKEDQALPQSIISTLRDRITHPVFGVFLVVWFMINWKPAFYLAAATSPADKRIQEALNYTSSETLLWYPLYATIGYLILSPVTRQAVAVYNVLFLRYEMSRNASLKLEAAEHDLRVSAVEERKLSLMIQSKARQLESLTEKFEKLEVELSNKHDARRIELDVAYQRRTSQLEDAYKNRMYELDENYRKRGSKYAADVDGKRAELLKLTEELDRQAALLIEPLQELADLRNSPGKIITQARSESLGRAASRVLSIFIARASSSKELTAEDRPPRLDQIQGNK